MSGSLGTGPAAGGDGPDLPDEAYAAALAGLGMGPARLAALLRDEPPPQAWAAARARRPGRDAVLALDDVADVWAAHQAAGVHVHLLGRPGYPERLASDHEAAAVLFSRGRIELLARPCVTVVGTRRCTHTGVEVARQLGRELAEAGVAVASGLALGIDGAAHEGALGAAVPAPVGVVGSGLDVVYPSRHRRLWDQVAGAGVLLSEVPLGGRPEAWRFPARNRLLAAMADVVVVVESHAAGGSMHTVRSAIERGVTVMAVPGSVRNPAAAGCNQLIADGIPPARDTEDVLVALGLATIGRGAGGGSSVGDTPCGGVGARPVPDGDDGEVLHAVGYEPTSFEEILDRSGLPTGRAATAVHRLEEAGWLRRSAGWFERVGP